MEERYQKHCYGCGATLQSEDSTKEGYLPKEVVEKREVDSLIVFLVLAMIIPTLAYLVG